MYVLYGGRFTRAVLPQIVLEEADLPYELRELDILAGDHRRPEYLALNPAGYLPALVTPEGEVLHEAAAIMLYLAERHGLAGLAPGAADARRGTFLSKLFFLTNDVQPAMKRAFYPERYSTDRADAPRIKARALATALERFRVVDRYPATNGPYHLGGRYSLVDPYLVFWALLYEARDELFAACPAVEGCCELVLRRPKAGPILKRVGSMRADYEAAKRG